MARWFMIAAAPVAVLALSATAFAQQNGTADEAKAMLMKAVAAVKADKAKALDMFNKGEGGFLDRDLYVYPDSLRGRDFSCHGLISGFVLGDDSRRLSFT